MALQAAGVCANVIYPTPQADYVVKSQQRRDETNTADALWLVLYVKERRPPRMPVTSFLQRSEAQRSHAIEKALT